MKLSKGYWQTYKETPNDAEIPSHILMMRSGMLQKQAGGLYTFMPMMMRVIHKIKNVVREELDKAGCHEVAFPVVTDGRLWKESGRWDAMGDLMLKAKDRAERDLCISPTNEEASTEVFKSTIKSYKQLPVTMYQINTKFRDEIRPRYGIMRCREFIMKDAYSFHIDKSSLDDVYQDLYQAYSNIFTRLGLEFMAVEADAGAMADGDQKTHEFQVIADSGEDLVIYCETGKYAANIEKAKTKRSGLNFKETTDSIVEVETKNKFTIKDVCEFLNKPQEQSLKALMYTAINGDEEIHYAIFILGDDNLNEIKLNNYLKADHIVQSSPEVMKKNNTPAGYIGPYNLSENLKLIYDQEVDLDKAYVVGANKEHYHLDNFIPSRDSKNYEVADLRLAKEGDICAETNGKALLKKGVEVGHIFQLGDKYSKSMNATVLDQNGKAVHPLMGCYGIGITRIVGAAIEQNHDEKGIIWPKAMAPYHVYFALIGKSQEIKDLAYEIYEDLTKSGVEVLLDDRGNGPGFMFKDSDLLGLPLRVTLGERDFNKTGEIEIKLRKSDEFFKVQRSDLIAKVQELLGEIS